MYFQDRRATLSPSLLWNVTKKERGEEDVHQCEIRGHSYAQGEVYTVATYDKAKEGEEGEECQGGAQRNSMLAAAFQEKNAQIIMGVSLPNIRK